MSEPPIPPEWLDVSPPRPRGWRRAAAAFDRYAPVLGTALALVGILLVLSKTPYHKGDVGYPTFVVVPATTAPPAPAEPAPPREPDAAAPG